MNLTDFRSKLLGTYHNQQQAYNNPAFWAHIYCKFEEVEDGDVLSSSWYAIESPDRPYRKSLLKMREEDNQIILTSINLLADTESCDVPFHFDNGTWFGENPRCEIPEKQMYVSTAVRFDGTNYFSRDAGYHLETNQFLWGKQPHEGFFHFIKV